MFYHFFATAWWQWLALPIQFVMAPLHGVIINWCAHYGYVSYSTSDTSKNMWPVEVIMMGEGLRNSYHTHTANANFAQKWWEFDPTYPVIWTLDKARIMKLRAA
jgi:stearoyl-CoA desaturase (Delta-9 desaturase)